MAALELLHLFAVQLYDLFLHINFLIIKSLKYTKLLSFSVFTVIALLNTCEKFKMSQKCAGGRSAPLVLVIHK